MFPLLVKATNYFLRPQGLGGVGILSWNSIRLVFVCIRQPYTSRYESLGSQTGEIKLEVTNIEMGFICMKLPKWWIWMQRRKSVRAELQGTPKSREDERKLWKDMRRNRSWDGQKSWLVWYPVFLVKLVFEEREQSTLSSATDRSG